MSCSFDNPHSPSSALGHLEIRWAAGKSWGPSELRYHVHTGRMDSAGVASRAPTFRGPQDVFISFKTRIEK